MMQCELGELDFSLIKRSSLKKAGPDICFQPLFKLVDFGQEEESEHSMDELEKTPKGVRFATSFIDEDIEHNNEIKDNEVHEERPLNSGLIFIPSLSR